MDKGRGGICPNLWGACTAPGRPLRGMIVYDISGENDGGKEYKKNPKKICLNAVLLLVSG